MDYLISSTFTTLFVGFLIYLCRKWIIIRLTESVKHEYSKDLEKIKSGQRQKEKEFSEELGRKSQEIEALKNGAMATIINKQGILNERRIEAAEKLWETVSSLSGVKNAAHLLQKINIEEVKKASNRHDPKIQNYFDILGYMVPEPPKAKDRIDVCRIFVSPYAWSLYSAYSATIWNAWIHLEAFKKGLDTNLINNKHVDELIETVLPHQKVNLDKYGTYFAYFCLEEIEGLILKEIQNMLEGDQYDKKNIERANSIMKHVDEVQQENSELLEKNESTD